MARPSDRVLTAEAGRPAWRANHVAAMLAATPALRRGRVATLATDGSTSPAAEMTSPRSETCTAIWPPMTGRPARTWSKRTVTLKGLGAAGAEPCTGAEERRVGSGREWRRAG